jgi:hypothetical protein
VYGRWSKIKKKMEKGKKRMGNEKTDNMKPIPGI